MCCGKLKQLLLRDCSNIFGIKGDMEKNHPIYVFVLTLVLMTLFYKICVPPANNAMQDLSSTIQRWSEIEKNSPECDYAKTQQS